MLLSIDLVKLGHFVALAEELNFTRAAERLGLGQQALSASISQFEAGLGVLLFVRTSRQVVLTDAGAALLREARPLLADARATLESVRIAASGEAQPLRVGYTPGVSRAMMLEHVAAWHVRHPQNHRSQRHARGFGEARSARMPVKAT